MLGMAVSVYIDAMITMMALGKMMSANNHSSRNSANRRKVV
jgi:hypothetical protein